MKGTRPRIRPTSKRMCSASCSSQRLVRSCPSPAFTRIVWPGLDGLFRETPESRRARPSRLSNEATEVLVEMNGDAPRLSGGALHLPGSVPKFYFYKARDCISPLDPCEAPCESERVHVLLHVMLNMHMQQSKIEGSLHLQESSQMGTARCNEMLEPTS